MNARTKNILIRALLIIALSLVTCVSIFAIANETKTPGLQGTLKATVKLGEEVQVPDYYAEVDGAVEKTTIQIVYPSSAVYAGSKFTASEAGRYTVNYLYNGKIYNFVS